MRSLEPSTVGSRTDQRGRGRPRRCWRPRRRRRAAMRVGPRRTFSPSAAGGTPRRDGCSHAAAVGGGRDLDREALPTISRHGVENLGVGERHAQSASRPEHDLAGSRQRDGEEPVVTDHQQVRPVPALRGGGPALTCLG